MSAIRLAAVAGSFYPDDPATLGTLLGRLLAERGEPPPGRRHKAIIAIRSWVAGTANTSCGKAWK